MTTRFHFKDFPDITLASDLVCSQATKISWELAKTKEAILRKFIPDSVYGDREALRDFITSHACTILCRPTETGFDDEEFWMDGRKVATFRTSTEVSGTNLIYMTEYELA